MKRLQDTTRLRLAVSEPDQLDDLVQDRSFARFDHAATGPRLQAPFHSIRRDLQYILQALRTSLPLWISDQLSLALAIACAGWASGLFEAGLPPGFAYLAGAFLVSLTVTNSATNLYPGIGLSAASELRQTTISLTLLFSIFLIATTLNSEDSARTNWALAGSYIVCLLLLPLMRRGTRTLVCSFSWWGQPALVFGGEEEGATAYRMLLENPESGLRPIGLLDDLHHHWLDNVTDPSWYLGPLNEVHQIASSKGVFWGIVAMPHRTASEVTAAIDRIALTVPNLVVLPDCLKAGRQWNGIHDCGGSLGARVSEILILPSPRFVKRAMDLILGSVLFVSLFPVMVLIAIAIKLSSPGKIIYKQVVPGVAGRRFQMWKFRSMFVNESHILADWLEQHPECKEEWSRHHKLRDDPRVTTVGRFLRKTSLDELPQFVNVLTGDMSLVGPRPYPLYECQEMQAKAPIILRMRPGISGLWQVSGRSSTTFDQRLLIDMKYVRNWSVWVDLVILAKTLVVVFRRVGAY